MRSKDESLDLMEQCRAKHGNQVLIDEHGFRVVRRNGWNLVFVPWKMKTEEERCLIWKQLVGLGLLVLVVGIVVHGLGIV